MGTKPPLKQLRGLRLCRHSLCASKHAQAAHINSSQPAALPCMAAIAAVGNQQLLPLIEQGPDPWWVFPLSPCCRLAHCCGCVAVQCHHPGESVVVGLGAVGSRTTRPPYDFCSDGRILCSWGSDKQGFEECVYSICVCRDCCGPGTAVSQHQLVVLFGQGQRAHAPLPMLLLFCCFRCCQQGGSFANFICNVTRHRPNGKRTIDWE